MRRLAALVLVAATVALVPSPTPAAEDATCHGLVATVIGTDGDDVIKGTAGDDVIAALGGNDVVRPGPGDDLVCGGRGNDYLTSRRGEDILIGGPGGDRIEGFSTRPTQLLGGAGDDFLFFTVTADPGYRLDGGAGRDIGDIRRDPGIEPGVALVIDRREGTFSRAGVLTGRYLGIEQVGVDELMGYAYLGSREPDQVSAAFGQFAFTAMTYGGKDVVVSSGGDDYIDAGRGIDRVDAGPGTDTCLHAERARGCESVTP